MYDNNESIFNSSLYKSVSQEEHFKENKNRLENNYGLKLGVVVEVLDIDNKKNTNKKFPEYTVISVEQDENNIFSVRHYNNCLNIDGFGGLADFFEYKLRSDTTKKPSPNRLDVDFSKQKANVVLLLCQDGVTDKAIILKSLSHKARKTTLTPENGLHLEGEYNGVNWQINKDGEFTLTFKSKTNNKGEPSNKAAGGTFAKIDKTGSFQIQDSSQKFLMDNENGGIQLDTGGDFKVSSTQNADIEATGNIGIGGNGISLTASKTDGQIKQTGFEWEADVLGTAKLKSKISLEVESTIVSVKAKANLEIESLQAILKSKVAIIDSDFTFVGKGASLPAPAFTTQYLGTVALIPAPIICNILTPSSKVFIAV